MRDALYGLDGTRKITVLEFLALEAFVLTPRLWRVHPICPECRDVVDPFGKMIAMGFNLRGASASDEWPAVGFRHRKDADPSCSRYRPDREPLPKDALEIKLARRSQREVLGVLERPEVVDFSCRVLARLVEVQTGQSSDPDVVAAMELKWRKPFSFMRALTRYSWVYPYVVALYQSGQSPVQQGLAGGAERVVWKGSYTQQALPFIDLHGQRRVAQVPERLQLCLATFARGSGKPYWEALRAANGTPLSFQISQKAAFELAGVASRQGTEAWMQACQRHDGLASLAPMGHS